MSPPPPVNSWLFVDAKLSLANDPNALVPSYMGMITFPLLSSDSTGNDFIGVKMGDIAGLMADTLQLSNGIGDTRQNLDFVMTDRAIEAGETYQLEVRARDFSDLIGYQWILDFNADYLTFQGVDVGDLENLSEANFGTSRLDEGQLILTWYAAVAQDMNQDEVIFTLNFQANKDAAKISELFSKTELEQFSAIAYDESEDAFNVDLVFEELEIETPVNLEFALYQNQPNPFKNETVIGFNLPEATKGTLTITDISGRTIKVFENSFVQGYNQIDINRAELSATGVLYYQLETPEHTATRKMIIIE